MVEGVHAEVGGRVEGAVVEGVHAEVGGGRIEGRGSGEVIRNVCMCV